MDIHLKPECTIVFIQSPFLTFILIIIAFLGLMTLALYLTNRRLCLEELTTSVYILRYEIPKCKFINYGILHCVTTKGSVITLVDPDFVFMDHVKKISPRELSEIKFCIEFKWRIILQMSINIMEISTESLKLKTVREV